MKTLSIIIPAYNEEKTIVEVLERLLALTLPGWEKEIIVVNDGSTDGAEKALARFFGAITYLRHSSNQGKGAAIRTAHACATGDAILIQDADLEYHPEDIPSLLAALSDERVDVVYGSRALRTRESGYLHYVAGARFLTHLVNACFGSQLTDVYTGYKLVRTSALKKLDLKCNGFEYEMELTTQLLKHNCRIVEVPICYTPRGFREGKKIRARDGIIGIMTLIKQYLRK